MICNFMIFSESVGSGACLSAKTSETPANINLQGFPFPGCRPTEKGENHGQSPGCRAWMPSAAPLPIAVRPLQHTIQKKNR